MNTLDLLVSNFQISLLHVNGKFDAISNLHYKKIFDSLFQIKISSEWSSLEVIKHK